ncbi:ankyrin repeat domain-containing protein [Marinobacter hydrocarbonoclasticus]|uniref:ankyrin repeat domain-containing protein n=1 Tax=Marinobacter nauticus TaxID=2743 RepID=UPI001A8F80A4|nr:ankyrin repeat domain-containing protein [Marinobacter nauticus]MBN8238552.1 ankyrin repeat domain-containing protein [Marinobacter nauticus]
MELTLDKLLISAVRNGNLDLVKERIEAGANVNYQDPQAGSALGAAIYNDDVSLAQYLLETGADANLPNEHGIVPLELALHYAGDSMVRKLAWFGGKITSRCRPHWRERLEACLRAH